jgi:hypothetical protein
MVQRWPRTGRKTVATSERGGEAAPKGGQGQLAPAESDSGTRWTIGARHPEGPADAALAPLPALFQPALPPHPTLPTRRHTLVRAGSLSATLHLALRPSVLFSAIHRPKNNRARLHLPLLPASGDERPAGPTRRGGVCIFASCALSDGEEKPGLLCNTAPAAPRSTAGVALRAPARTSLPLWPLLDSGMHECVPTRSHRSDPCQLTVLCLMHDILLVPCWRWLALLRRLRDGCLERICADSNFHRRDMPRPAHRVPVHIIRARERPILGDCIEVTSVAGTQCACSRPHFVPARTSLAFAHLLVLPSATHYPVSVALFVLLLSLLLSPSVTRR